MKKNSNIIGIKARSMPGILGANKYYKSDWRLVAYLIPRQALEDTRTKFTEPELLHNSIYFLVGNQDGDEKLYVGRAEKRADGLAVIPRLREHTKPADANYGFWNYAIAITNESGLWGATEIHQLEYLFYNLVPKENRTNRAVPPTGGDTEEDYDEKVRQIIAFLVAMGISAFSEKEDASKIQIEAENDPNQRVEDLQKGLSSIPEIITPKKVVNSVLDTLPAEVWNPYTTFLDPACKGGEFLKAIYDRLMVSESLVAMYPDKIQRAIHILDKQIFGIALSSISKDRATRKLMDFGRNIITVPYYLDLLKNSGQLTWDKPAVYAEEEILKLFGRENMKFDIVVGNPPYQDSSKSIYDVFIRLGMGISKKNVCMITKNNWLSSDTLRGIREQMLNNGLKSVINYPIIGELFNGVSPSVAIFNVEHGYTGKVHYKGIKNGCVENEYHTDMRDMPIIFKDSVQASVYSKISKFITENNFGRHTYPEECFRINSNGSVGRGNARYELKTMQEMTDEYKIAVLYMDKNREKYYRYIKDADIPSRRELAYKYKVLCGCKFSMNSSIISSVSSIGKNAVVTSSYNVLYASDNEADAKRAERYIKTKLFRFLVGLCIDGGLTSISSYRFRLVPDQDFTSSSDIDWSQSITDIDKQLYKKYGLTDAEIQYIEKTIKAME